MGRAYAMYGGTVLPVPVFLERLYAGEIIR
jgi:hypothetical protein